MIRRGRMKRLYRGLRKRPPRESYDAVVIGAGVGGLVSANLLAREGLSVLLVEQHYMAGGYCSTFRRAGFTFDAATHFYPLLGNPETLTGKLLEDLGVRTGWVKMDPVDTFHLPDGSRFTVPADLATYRRRLDQEFPHHAAALEDFFAEVRRAYLVGLLAYFREKETRSFRQLADLDLAAALRRFFPGDDDASRKLRLVLTADCPHWGSPPKRTSFVFDAMLRLSYFLGNYYPKGGSQAFADDLARCFEEAGGEILMSTRAEGILVEAGRAVGVELSTTRGPLSGRRRVRAGQVISNADLRLTVQQRLPSGGLDPAYLRQVESLRPSFPCFLSHLGVEGIPREVLDRVQGYYWRHWDPDGVGGEALICKIFVPTLYEPEMAPPGHDVILLQKVLDQDPDRVEDWNVHKAAVEGAITRQLEAVLEHAGGLSRPFAEHRVVQLSATARTAERFTLNYAGAMLGWEMSPEQLGAARPGVENPLLGLTLVGHWTRPGGGITPVIVSALRAVESLLGRRPSSLATLPAGLGAEERLAS